jgi:membrane protease YdiL (CAAX protease family)
MQKINSFAIEHPIIFGLIAMIVFLLMLILSAILGNLWPGDEIYGQPGGILGRLIAIIILLAVLSRLGWLRPAGLLSLGSWRVWLVSLLSLVYTITLSTYAFTGNIDFDFSRRLLSGMVILFILVAAFLEEVVFRGLILDGFVRAWGGTNPGLLKSILFSSLFFCSIHLLDFLSGRPLASVLLQGLEAFFLGVFLAASVLSGKSIYPATFFHGLLNLSAYMSFASQGLEPKPASWLLLSLLILPLAFYGLFFVCDLSQRPTFPHGTHEIRTIGETYE